MSPRSARATPMLTVVRSGAPVVGSITSDSVVCLMRSATEAARRRSVWGSITKRSRESDPGIDTGARPARIASIRGPRGKAGLGSPRSVLGSWASSMSRSYTPAPFEGVVLNAEEVVDDVVGDRVPRWGCPAATRGRRCVTPARRRRPTSPPPRRRPAAGEPRVRVRRGSRRAGSAPPRRRRRRDHRRGR